MLKLASAINCFNEKIGQTISWLSLIMILVQFIVVVMRYIFGVGSIMMQESIIFMYSALFLVGSGFTLLKDGHVRVDIFYREASPITKAKVDLFGSIFLLIPVCSLILIASWGYVIDSWIHLEGSKETSGIQAYFILKTFIWVFAVLVMAQGISMAITAWLTIKGVIEPKQGEGDFHDLV